jgi:hypothetical protein
MKYSRYELIDLLSLDFRLHELSIEGMQILPKEVSKFDIPLCRMVYMLLVRPTLAHDIKRLEAEFTQGYWPGALTGPQLTMNLKPSWLQTVTYAFFVVVCFSSVMGTIGLRHGQVTFTGCTEMTLRSIISWTTSASIPKAREACS